MQLVSNNLPARSARLAVVLTVLAVCAAAFGASSANAAFSATYSARCSGSGITGAGATFQNQAQTAWIGFWGTDGTYGCPTPTYTTPPINYTGGGSGAGRNAFGATGGTRSATVRYIGVDEAPTPAQRTTMEAGDPSTATDNGKLAIVPVAQGSTTVIVNFPQYCQLPAGSSNLASYARFKLTDAVLEKVWEGDSTADTWGEILPDIEAIPGAPRTTAQCAAVPVKRVVRVDSSGTTFAFKKFLKGINPSFTWEEPTLGNTAWPNNAGATAVLTGTGTGGGPLATKVAQTFGSIGYVDLASARAAGFKKESSGNGTGVNSTCQSTDVQYPGQYIYNQEATAPGLGTPPRFGWCYTFSKTKFWLPLEGATSGGALPSNTYYEPVYTTDAIRLNRKGANCSDTTSYSGTPAGSVNGFDPYGDWSGVTAALSPQAYPLCTLTYGGFWDDYSDVYGNTATEEAKARTVKDYFTAILYSGQDVLRDNDYAKLPNTTQKLRLMGQTTIKASNWNKP